MGIASKLRDASRACRYVQKDGTNAFHKYRFASAANVLGHVNEALHLAGAAVVDTDVTILSETGAGKDRVVTAKVSIVVRDTETEETATFRGIGSGQDSGDKAVMKATTAAQKYAWILGLSIETGEDPEADEKTDQHNDGRSTQSPRRQPSPRAPAQSREEVTQPTREDVHVDQPAPAEPPAALTSFLARVEEVELPGEAVAVWMKHRTDLASLPALDREAAWKALCTKTELVGKMKNAKVWLRKAIAEEDERAARKASEAQPS